jgi:Cu-Zn family superoxide dismutase
MESTDMNRPVLKRCLACVSAVLISVPGISAYGARPVTAWADIAGCDGTDISGHALLVERPSSEGVKQVRVILLARGLPPGEHAVHIHETAACTPCSAAGGHFDPGPASLSSPDGNHPFHSGDLINLRVNRGGNGIMTTTTTRITLSPGPLSINDADGSAFIIHVDPDTYCPDGAVAGCAGGARAACGVINVD